MIWINQICCPIVSFWHRRTNDGPTEDAPASICHDAFFSSFIVSLLTPWSRTDLWNPPFFSQTVYLKYLESKSQVVMELEFKISINLRAFNGVAEGCRPLQPWNEQLDLRFATAFGTLGTCGERGLAAPWQAERCVRGRWSCPPSPPRCVSTPLTIWGGDFEIRQRDSFRASVVLLFGFSKCFFPPPSRWNLQLSGSKCVFTGAHTAAGLLRYLTKFFRERQTSTCLGRSSSRSIFRRKSHATERATWRAKVVSLTSALIQKLPCGRQVD